MGCFNSKNIADDDGKTANQKELSKIKESSVAKGKNLGAKFNINATDFVGEKTGKINQSYNLLMPPLGKGNLHKQF